jgi:hypothetical protein
MEVPEMQPFLLSLWICPLAPLAVQALPNSNLTYNKYKKILSSFFDSDLKFSRKKENNGNTYSN